MPLTAPEIIEAFTQQIVFFPRYRRAYELIQKGIETTTLSKQPACTALWAPVGTGKSTLLEFVKGQYGDETIKTTSEGSFHIVPVIYVSVPAKVTIKDLAKAILDKLHIGVVNGVLEDLSRLVIQNLKICQTKVILLDEFQNFAKPNSAKTAEDAAEWLRGILDATKIPIIVVGLPPKKDQQDFIYSRPVLAARFPYFAELSNLQYSDSAKGELLTVLHGLDKKMYELADLGRGAHLSDPTIYAPLYLACQGNLKWMRLIILGALTDCLSRSPRTLSLEDFSVSYSQIRLDEDLARKDNPFQLGTAKCLKLILEV
ncbi:TniB family NTP-binding protein [Pseudomonas sp. TCU-HL1]|uniref:TniB family NTP-binding protein n=1 Tax=Pseudomonas sp. TCU-HL1 TaxID=1856685 RepID=UPI00083D64F3|nr:TniB family NTP-binding protein [Pseudomonas sp. TCU-HL1]AOE85939.1 hypothetical protein THL1_3391 [Pseudomonas sp. TCU-HL1]